MVTQRQNGHIGGEMLFFVCVVMLSVCEQIMARKCAVYVYIHVHMYVYIHVAMCVNKEPRFIIVHRFNYKCRMYEYVECWLI
jgi:hypothetical protein